VPETIDPRIKALHRALEWRRPRLVEPLAGVVRASVTVLVRPARADLELLLIERPVRPGDPWSGHMALPGGRSEPGEDPMETAIRETREEVGVDVERGGLHLGRLDEVQPSRGGPQIAVAPFVFAVPTGTQLFPSAAEVATALWVPVRHLSDPASAAEHLHRLPGGAGVRFPAVRYHHHVIWGLTFRILMQFLEIARATRDGEAS
jgi:8-oxo-dGTP pyrophosphatase MutT (NUDIX family)